MLNVQKQGRIENFKEGLILRRTHWGISKGRSSCFEKATDS